MIQRFRVKQLRSNQISDMPTPIKSVNSYDDEMSDMDISIVLVQMLGEGRRDKKHFWTDIGKALFKSSDGGVDGLDTWIDFTQGSEYFDEDDCRSTYPTFVLIQLRYPYHSSVIDSYIWIYYTGTY